MRLKTNTYEYKGIVYFKGLLKYNVGQLYYFSRILHKKDNVIANSADVDSIPWAGWTKV